MGAMCRNIQTLYNFEPPATEDEVRAAALQYVRKISGFTKPSRANEEAFGWAVDESNEMGYGMVPREGNTGREGIGIGGGIAGGPPGYEGHVTFYVAVPDVEEALQQAENLGGERVMGPETIMGRLVLGHFK